MRVEIQNSGIATLATQRRELDREVQVVFSQVLMEAGRAGYASASLTAADASQSEPPLEERMQAAWERWYGAAQSGQSGQPLGGRSRTELGADFGNLLQRAYAEGGYAAPQAFLSGLSQPELATLQHVHRLADPIAIDSLSEEGSLNLLLPAAVQVDMNQDGLTQCGAGQLLRFPDSNTPPDVVEAWHAATQDMPPAERMIYELQMVLPVRMANMVTGPDGRFVRERSPGDPDFVNPLMDADYSYAQAAQSWIEHLDYFKNQMQSERYWRAREFWQSFRDHLLGTKHETPGFIHGANADQGATASDTRYGGLAAGGAKA